MILKGSERGGARQLANHLLRGDENEHVELHEIRGFVADDLTGAFHEAYGHARGTRCRNFLFSLSLNPPDDKDVPAQVFESAIQRIEDRLGLQNQPRAIVFHEKQGRRHAHCVWSRIDLQAMKARRLPHFKRKLNTVAKELYLEHGWTLRRGFIQGQARDPLTFTRAEWQQAKRAKRDPKALKAMLRDCWASSDNAKAFEHALKERGFYLARGDRRGFVALDYRGEVYSLSRYIGVKAKALQQRLGDPDKRRSVDDAKAWVAQRMTANLRRQLAQLENKQARQSGMLETRRGSMVVKHREAREKLRRQHSERRAREDQERAARLPRGVKAVWSWITGKYKELRRQNEADLKRSEARDRTERQALIAKQLQERRDLQSKIRAMHERQAAARAELEQDIAAYLNRGEDGPIRFAGIVPEQGRKGPEFEP